MESFSPYTLSKIDLECLICPCCHDSPKESKTETWIYHTNGGEKHPIHKKCASIWADTKSTCMSCLVQVDTSLFERDRPLIERIWKILCPSRSEISRIMLICIATLLLRGKIRINEIFILSIGL